MKSYKGVALRYAEDVLTGRVICGKEMRQACERSRRDPERDDPERDAPAYRRDLGLTPKDLKAIDEAAMKPKRTSALAAALKELGGQTLFSGVRPGAA